MNYSLIRACDIANGPGVRVSLFVSGCTHHCPGCFQPETWNFNAKISICESSDSVTAPYSPVLLISSSKVKPV